MTRISQFADAARCMMAIKSDPQLKGAFSLKVQFYKNGRLVAVLARWPDNSQKTFAVRQLDDGAWELGAPIALPTEN